jgi:hypothetical protein
VRDRLLCDPVERALIPVDNVGYFSHI